MRGRRSGCDGRWLAFDPTNDKLVDERHVTLAWGRDYDDVPPLRGGVIYTDSTKSHIDVSVDVSPAQSPEPEPGSETPRVGTIVGTSRHEL